LVKNITKCYCFEANDGNEAVLYLKKEKPDIVLMDIQMPNKMDMKQREIRLLSYGFQNPIVALTAGIMIDEKEKWSQE
jgi:CheY-like chemotaxis protein